MKKTGKHYASCQSSLAKIYKWRKCGQYNYTIILLQHASVLVDCLSLCRCTFPSVLTSTSSLPAVSTPAVFWHLTNHHKTLTKSYNCHHRRITGEMEQCLILVKSVWHIFRSAACPPAHRLNRPDHWDGLMLDRSAVGQLSSRWESNRTRTELTELEPC